MAILELDGCRLSPKMPKGKITVRYGMNNFKYRLIYQYLISLLLTFKRLFHIPTPRKEIGNSQHQYFPMKEYIALLLINPHSHTNDR